MRSIAMCPTTVRVARTLRVVPGTLFQTEQGVCRTVVVFDDSFATLCGLTTKRVREGLLNLERLGALLAEDLLPGPSKIPKGRTILVNEYSAAWRWLDAFDAMELAYKDLSEVSQ
jgi:hypothetical protein